LLPRKEESQPRQKGNILGASVVHRRFSQLCGGICWAMATTAPRDDWWWGVQSQYCAHRMTYSPSAGDVSSKCIMAALWIVSVLLVLLMPRRTEDVGLAASPAGTASRERWVFLDVARIGCVFCVIVEHTGGMYFSSDNTAFVTQWVLQWLFIISGVAFMMSNARFQAYMSRYGAIFVVGVVCNIIGDAIGRPMWYTDCGNTVYQMFYVLVIIMLAFFAWPLRATLRDDAEPFGGTSSVRWLSNYASDRALTLALYSTLWLATAACYFSGVDILSILEEWDPLFSQSSWTMYIRDIIRAPLPLRRPHPSRSRRAPRSAPNCLALPRHNVHAPPSTISPSTTPPRPPHRQHLLPPGPRVRLRRHHRSLRLPPTRPGRLALQHLVAHPLLHLPAAHPHAHECTSAPSHLAPPTHTTPRPPRRHAATPPRRRVPLPLRRLHLTRVPPSLPLLC
jgi:hypothetical protein